MKKIIFLALLSISVFSCQKHEEKSHSIKQPKKVIKKIPKPYKQNEIVTKETARYSAWGYKKSDFSKSKWSDSRRYFFNLANGEEVRVTFRIFEKYKEGDIFNKKDVYKE